MTSNEIRKKLDQVEALLNQVLKLTRSQDAINEIIVAIGHIRNAKDDIVDVFEIGKCDPEEDLPF